MKHLRTVTAYRVGNKLHRTKKAARKDAGKGRRRRYFFFFSILLNK